MFRETKTVIGSVTVRVKGTSSDALSAGQRISGLLEAIDLRPHGLAASAILVINRMRDPLPGRLSLYDQRRTQEWEHRVNDVIANLARTACRPASGTVPTNSGAVLFSDRSELLACLSRDWCNGSVIEQWWWRTLFKTAGVRSTVLNAWLEAPEYAPAALEQLAASSTLIRFVRMLGSSDSRKLLQSITSRFVLPDLAATCAAIPMFVAAPPGSSKVLFAGKAPLQPGAVVVAESLPGIAPWWAWAPEVFGYDLDPLQECLLGIGLTLARAPHVARSRSFAQDVRRWSRIEAQGDGGMAPVFSSAAAVPHVAGAA
nr:hypothetical protein [Desulfuromonadaceae bacterium]